MINRAGTLIWFRDTSQTVLEDIYIPEAEAKGAGHGELSSKAHLKLRDKIGR